MLWHTRRSMAGRSAVPQGLREPVSPGASSWLLWGSQGLLRSLGPTGANYWEGVLAERAAGRAGEDVVLAELCLRFPHSLLAHSPENGRSVWSRHGTALAARTLALPRHRAGQDPRPGARLGVRARCGAVLGSGGPELAQRATGGSAGAWLMAWLAGGQAAGTGCTAHRGWAAEGLQHSLPATAPGPGAHPAPQTGLRPSPMTPGSPNGLRCPTRAHGRGGWCPPQSGEGASRPTLGPREAH